jgi:ABC-type nitrate/sulfonate/bicarbonate transport system substrate-binding protein
MMLFSSFSLEGVSAQDKVRIGVTNPNMVFLNARIALAKGFFQEEGIQAEVIRMNPSVMITAAGTGDLDYPLVFGSVVRAAIRGLPLRITSNFMNGPMHVLVARSEFKTIQDLKGRTIGIDSHGATSEVTGRMIYKHFGMELEKDSKVIALAAAARSGIETNLVHGIIVTPPGQKQREWLSCHRARLTSQHAAGWHGHVAKNPNQAERSEKRPQGVDQSKPLYSRQSRRRRRGASDGGASPLNSLPRPTIRRSKRSRKMAASRRTVCDW